MAPSDTQDDGTRVAELRAQLARLRDENARLRDKERELRKSHADLRAIEEASVEHSGQGRLLFMDDDEQLRFIAQTALQELGYQVDVAAHGEEALDFYRRAQEEGRPFLVVVLDLTIRAGLGGKETMAKLLEMAPDVCAIVSSGYSDDEVLGRYADFGFRAVMPKPYRMQDLAETLRLAIGGRRS